MIYTMSFTKSHQVCIEAYWSIDLHAHNNISRKPYIDSRMTPSHLALSQGYSVKVTQIVKPYNSLRSRPLSMCQATDKELGHMLLLNINRKPCMGSPLVRLHMPLMTLRGLCQRRSLSFQRLISRKGDKISLRKWEYFTLK